MMAKNVNKVNTSTTSSSNHGVEHSTTTTTTTTPSSSLLLPKKVILPHKEASLFKSILSYYEHKQYKKGLKTTEQILRKFPTHAESIAMKGLFLFQLDKKVEGYDLAKTATLYDSESHICWHVYGLMHRADRNYSEAAKCYVNALKIDKDNLQILRDLALIQLQLRNYTGCIETRKKLAQLLRGGHQRLQFLGLSVLYHILGNPIEALHQLDEYEASLVPRPSSKDSEYTQVLFYRTLLLEEQKEVESALHYLESMETYIADIQTYRLHRARLLLKLGRQELAMAAYLQLIHSNPDHKEAIEAFIVSTHESRVDVLHDLCAQFPTSSLLPILLLEAYPLTSTSSNDMITEFEDVLKRFLIQHIHKCVPSTYVQLKSILNQPEKRDCVERLLLEFEANTSYNQPCLSWLQFFLAQHADYKKDYPLAMTYIEKAIQNSQLFSEQEEHEEVEVGQVQENRKSESQTNGNGFYSSNEKKTPLSSSDDSTSLTTLCSSTVPVEFYMLRARIYKHTGHFTPARCLMNAVRELDLKDRFVNTKCTKYMLRDNALELALSTIQCFTLPNANPLKDLTDLQCMWYFTESAEALVRLRDYSKALEHYHKVLTHFNEIEDDQFDFHVYCLRKVCLTTYKDLLTMEQHLRGHPFYLRCAFGALQVYLYLHDTQTNSSAVSKESDSLNSSSTSAPPTTTTKTKTSTLITPSSSSSSSSIETNASSKSYLDLAHQLIKKMEEDQVQDPRMYQFSFDVYLRQGRWLLALRALKKLLIWNSTDHPSFYRFFYRVVQLSQASFSQTMPGPFQVAIEKETLPWCHSRSLAEYIQHEYQSKSFSLSFMLATAYAYLELNRVDRAREVITSWIDAASSSSSDSLDTPSSCLVWKELTLKSAFQYIDEWNWVQLGDEVKDNLKQVVLNHYALE